jgi:hypothetical protein
MTMRTPWAAVLLALAAGCTHATQPSSQTTIAVPTRVTISPSPALHGCPADGFRNGISFDARPFAVGHPSVRSLRVALNGNTPGSRIVRLNQGLGYLVDDPLRFGHVVLIHIDPRDIKAQTLASGETKLRPTKNYPHGPDCQAYWSIDVVVSPSGSLHQAA